MGWDAHTQDLRTGFGVEQPTGTSLEQSICHNLSTRLTILALVIYSSSQAALSRTDHHWPIVLVSGGEPWIGNQRRANPDRTYALWVEGGSIEGCTEESGLQAEIKSNVVFGKFGLIRRQAVAEPVCCLSPVVRL
jgi:hypothetical protein